jgi:hypothetical protein
MDALTAAKVGSRGDAARPVANGTTATRCRAILRSVSEFEIEYLDDQGQDRSAAVSESWRVTRDARIATFVEVVGWVLACAAIVAAIVLALAYVPSTGDPLGPPGQYVGGRGLPYGADAVIGLVGLVLGLGLVALGRLIANTSATVSRLAAIERALTERADDEDNA